MKVKSVRYGKVIPNRDGTKFSTERVEVEVEATEDNESFQDLFDRAKALTGLGLGEFDVDALREEATKLNNQLERLRTLGIV